MKSARIDNRWGNLHLVLDDAGEVPVLRCVGRIVTGTETAALSAVVQSHFRRDLVLDLSDVSAIDAGGLGTLVTLCLWADKHGSRLILSNPSRIVRKLMDLTGLSWLLETCYLPHGCFESVEPQRCTA